MAVSREKRSQKARDKLIVIAQRKLDKLIDKSFTDYKVLQEMSKITVIFIPNGYLPKKRKVL
jgi:hypothetical protein